jgi:hypothetical protein
MLSRAWLEQYDRLYNSFAMAAQSIGLPYRLEETNNFTGGAKDASDAFASALWVLDYLHWWAAHHAVGLNFHNRRWILNTTIYPVTASDDGVTSGYRLHPIGFGMKAFDLGGHGIVVPVTMVNPDALNLTSYAVRDGNNFFVTLINKKDPDEEAHDANVIISAAGIRTGAAAIFLTAPNQDLAAKEGITLGGTPVLDGTSIGSWAGTWTPLTPGTTDSIAVKVPGASAAIIRLPVVGEK